MYVLIYVCVNVCMNLYMYEKTYVCMRICIYVCMYLSRIILAMSDAVMGQVGQHICMTTHVHMEFFSAPKPLSEHGARCRVVSCHDVPCYVTGFVTFHHITFHAFMHSMHTYRHT